MRISLHSFRDFSTENKALVHLTSPRGSWISLIQPSLNNGAELPQFPPPISCSVVTKVGSSNADVWEWKFSIIVLRCPSLWSWIIYTAILLQSVSILLICITIIYVFTIEINGEVPEIELFQRMCKKNLIGCIFNEEDLRITCST